MCIITFMILLFLIYFLFFNKREGYEDPFIEGIRDRFIDPMNRRYTNQIDYYRNAPNINLERALSQPTITTDEVDWSKVSDYEYPILINYLSGRNDATKIKSINAN
jgi:hypothetical protein